MSEGLLDTSVLITAGDELGGFATGAISVITIGELSAGVTLARSPEVRAARQRRLVRLRATFEVLVVDEVVAEAYGDLLAFARSERRITSATDLLIVATTAASGRTLHTADEAQARLATAFGVPVAS